MTAVDALKAGALLLVAAPLQVSVFSSIEVVEGHPDVVLVLLVAIALLRGPIFGSVAGFWAGLALDVASFGTPGLMALLLTIAGYWCGRFGDATRRSSAHVPLIAVGFAAVAVGLGSLVVRFMLGSATPASEFVVAVLVPTVALDLLLAYPIYALCRLLFPPVPRPREVSAVG